MKNRIIFGCIILFVKREMFFDKSIVYVTASDENYFKRSMNLLRSINKFDPKQKVVFYDLGLNETQQKTYKWRNIKSTNLLM